MLKNEKQQQKQIIMHSIYHGWKELIGRVFIGGKLLVEKLKGYKKPCIHIHG